MFEDRRRPGPARDERMLLLLLLLPPTCCRLPIVGHTTANKNKEKRGRVGKLGEL